MKGLISIILLLFCCTTIQSQEKWVTVYNSDKSTAQIKAEIDINSIEYKDNLIYFTERRYYKGLIRKQFILKITPIVKRKDENIDISNFAYTLEKVAYNPEHNQFKTIETYYYDNTGNRIFSEINDNMLIYWFDISKGSIMEIVVNAVIENLDL